MEVDLLRRLRGPKAKSRVKPSARSYGCLGSIRAEQLAVFALFERLVASQRKRKGKPVWPLLYRSSR